MARKTISLEAIRKTARERFGYQQLWPPQEEAIRLLLEGHDVLSVMPTGSGKSAIYQLAGLFFAGPTVIVSPLIALQKDQLDSIDEKNLPDAAVLNSAQRVSEQQETFDKLEQGRLEFLFLAPEQLGKTETLERFHENPPSLFVVDEAHCISEWGHDFRPDYVRIGTVVEAINHPRVLALTATASPQVREDIVRRLYMKNTRMVIGGFDRPNIRLEVENCAEEEIKQRFLLTKLHQLPRPGIVYVATRSHAQEIARVLRDAGIPADHYHAGMNPEERTRTQETFMNSNDRVIVATNAFGMGVDKPNVRFVLHYDLPESMDEYYQEVGRAGRDDQPATATLLYRPQDAGRRRAQASKGKLSTDQVEKVVEVVNKEGEPVEPAKIEEQTGVPEGRVERVLNRLADVGAVEILPTGEAAPGEEIEPAEAAEEVVQQHDNYRNQRRGRVDIMQDYAESPTCRRKYVLEYFGEQYDGPCNNCDNCLTGTARPAAEAQHESGQPFPLRSHVRHAKWGDGIVMRYEGQDIVIFFQKAGYKKLSTPFVLQRNLLQRVA